MTSREDRNAFIAFSAGQRAYHQGADLKDNPHLPGDLFDAWEDGWHDANQADAIDDMEGQP